MCCRTHYSAFWKSSALSCRRNGQLCSSTTMLPLPRVPRPSAFLCFSSSSAVCRWLYFLSAPLGMVTSDHEVFLSFFVFWSNHILAGAVVPAGHKFTKHSSDSRKQFCSLVCPHHVQGLLGSGWVHTSGFLRHQKCCVFFPILFLDISISFLEKGFPGH